jgi:methylphosphotriester-DNA--protein-cysteine methyltransferase
MVTEALDMERSAMWAAFSRRDAGFDGRFVAAVRTTRIFCRPSCPCRRPRPDRVEYYPTPAAATRAGYRACKRCLPELPGGSAEADRRFAERALAAMRVRLDEPLTLVSLARVMAASPSTLGRRFRAVDGRTPMRALADLRAERAEALLLDARITALEAGLSAGFGSPAAFARAFRRRTGRSPAAWRRAMHAASRGRTARPLIDAGVGSGREPGAPSRSRASTIHSWPRRASGDANGT